MPPSPTLLFYPAVFMIAWWLGRWPAAIATVASAAGIFYSFVEPVGALGLPTLLRDTIDVALFCGVSAVATIFAGR